MSFVKSFLEFTKDYESPTSFFKWSAYAILSATIRDNLILDEGHRIFAPNLYVLLLATSAMHRKSMPVGLAGDLLAELRNTKLIRGRTSIQAVLDDLAGIETDKKTGQPIRGGSCLLCAEELASFIVNSPEAIDILTDIYDYRKEWDSRLRGSGKFKITNLCVTMLAASNEAMLKDIYLEKAIYGGLLRRTCFIKPNEYRKGNSLIKKEAGRYDISSLVQQLKDISKLKGELTFVEAAEREYDFWYLGRDGLGGWREMCREREDRTGILSGVHTIIKKIAIILAVNECSKTIEKRHVEEAINEGLNILPNYDNFVFGSGKSPKAEVAALLLEELYKAPRNQIPRREFLFRHFMDVDGKDLDDLIITLEQAEMIKSVVELDGTSYRLTSKALDKFNSKKEKVQ